MNGFGTYRDVESVLNGLEKINGREGSIYREIQLIEKYGYLPYSHQRVLDDIGDVDLVRLLRVKLEVYKLKMKVDSGDVINPVGMAGISDSSWLGKEHHQIKLINLSGLGNGNVSEEAGKLMDWLRQLLILPVGAPEKGVLGDTVYLLPFHTREFNCNYIPKALDVSYALIDHEIEEKMTSYFENQLFNGEEQIRFFIQAARACGHPVIYDVLPQTGRFNLEIVKNPYIVRWFDVKTIEEWLKECPESVSYDEWAKKCSDRMGQKLEQEKIVKKVYGVLNEYLSEKGGELTDAYSYHNDLIGVLIANELWPAPGGAWNSAYMPVYKGKDEYNTPIFDHFTKEGLNVNESANLDCQSPYYFYHFSEKEYNDSVIDFWINQLLDLQDKYKFDGYRVDHVDHVTDYYSLEDGNPISYCAPPEVLKRMNERLKAKIPTFATLAEYMLWDNLKGVYHQEMGFDVLWGDDMISQFRKHVAKISEDNEELANYNRYHGGEQHLSVLKTYNNQDGVFEPFNQYPGQLTESGAIFKWLKLHFIPGGEDANRSIIYVDGDESFTKKGVQYGINNEVALAKNRDDGFTQCFYAIERLVKNSLYMLRGPVRWIVSNNADGFSSWMLTDPDSNEGMLIVANEKAPTECQIDDDRNMIYVSHEPCYKRELHVPDGYYISGEYELRDGDYVVNHDFGATGYMWYEKLVPSEYHIYEVRKG